MSFTENALLNADNLSKIETFANAENSKALASIAPSFITLDLTWNCNYNCLDCIDSRARDGSFVVAKHQGKSILQPDPNLCRGPFLPFGYVESILDYVGDNRNGVRGIQIMGGETLMYNEIDRFLVACHQKGVKLGIITNGSLIKHHVEVITSAFSTPGSWIRVSINGWNSYAQRIGLPKGSREDPRDQLLEGLQFLVKSFRDLGVDSPPIMVSTVAFDTAMPDIPDIASRVAEVGINEMFIIRCRDAQQKTLLDLNDPRDELRKLCEKANSICKTINPHFKAIISENLLVESKPQPRPYQPCPSAFFKALIGGDGCLYLCSDQRGTKSARLVDLKDYQGDFRKAWESEERISKTINYSPMAYCEDLLCLRHDANVKLHALRSYRQWYDITLSVIKSRKNAPWWF